MSELPIISPPPVITQLPKILRDEEKPKQKSKAKVPAKQPPAQTSAEHIDEMV